MHPLFQDVETTMQECSSTACNDVRRRQLSLSGIDRHEQPLLPWLSRLLAPFPCSRSEYEMKPLDSPSEHAQQKTTACMSNNRTALCYYVRVWNVSWMNPSARQTK